MPCRDKSHSSHGNILYMPLFVENAEFIIMGEVLVDHSVGNVQSDKRSDR